VVSELIPISVARELVLSATSPLGEETVPVAAGLDRFLAADVIAAGDVPPFSSSAMDGYAVIAGPAERSLRLDGEARAGSPAGQEVEAQTAIRISTGAEVPAGATAVIRQEDVEVRDGAVMLRREVRPGANVRPAGEVMRAGDVVLHRGTRLGPAELGVAVSAGAGELRVGRRPTLAVVCTGDELRDPGEPLAAGEIHNSNAVLLEGMAVHGGAVVSVNARLADDPSATRQGLDEALQAADVLVISGGVSVGPHDHVKPALAELEVSERFWGVSLQPGKPTWFGTREQKLVFGLPGNPVSAAVTFALFVAPALAALQGAATPLPPRREGILGSEISGNPSREQAVRVRLETSPEGLVAHPNGPQPSHHITSLVGADALAMIPATHGTVPVGTRVALEPLPR